MVVGIDEIYDLDVDVYVLCVLGVMVNDNIIFCLKVMIVVGCVNN